ncbi:unnamed protein product [Effrenium voratum]|uniref:Uncharacterized protein n=1 Tax=Effrenium voratum TaxID=2562239 RepID=A0AA36MPV2_9DINO|nr:unnamed protein product [Effrenium voratum]
MAAVSLVDLLTGAGPAQPLLCVRDEALTLRFASGPQEFGRKWTLEREVLNASARRKPPQRPSAWVGAARRRCRLDSHKVLQRQLFPFQLGRLRRVLLDHLERIFDLGAVYHDFYAGALAEHGGPLLFRAALAKPSVRKATRRATPIHKRERLQPCRRARFRPLRPWSWWEISSTTPTAGSSASPTFAADLTCRWCS